MTRNSIKMIYKLLFIVMFMFLSGYSGYSVANEPMSIIEQIDQASLLNELSSELKVAGGLTLLSFIPLIVISMTAFLRIVIVFSMLRHALGIQQTPPNIVIITMALFLTFFTMAPAVNEIENTALSPYLKQEISLDTAITNAIKPLRAFMISQTREQDMAVILKVSNTAVPKNASEVATSALIPAFMLSELTTAFKIAFVIFIPFLLVDLVVATVLMSLGMIMVPPISIALPLKIMLFVIIDGWALLTESLITSFY